MTVTAPFFNIGHAFLAGPSTFQNCVATLGEEDLRQGLGNFTDVLAHLHSRYESKPGTVGFSVTGVAAARARTIWDAFPVANLREELGVFQEQMAELPGYVGLLRDMRGTVSIKEGGRILFGLSSPPKPASASAALKSLTSPPVHPFADLQLSDFGIRMANQSRSHLFVLWLLWLNDLSVGLSPEVSKMRASFLSVVLDKQASPRMVDFAIDVLLMLNRMFPADALFLEKWGHEIWAKREWDAEKDSETYFLRLLDVYAGGLATVYSDLTCDDSYVSPLTSLGILNTVAGRNFLPDAIRIRAFQYAHALTEQCFAQNYKNRDHLSHPSHIDGESLFYRAMELVLNDEVPVFETRPSLREQALAILRDEVVRESDARIRTPLYQLLSRRAGLALQEEYDLRAIRISDYGEKILANLLHLDANLTRGQMRRQAFEILTGEILDHRLEALATFLWLGTQDSASAESLSPEANEIVEIFLGHIQNSPLGDPRAHLYIQLLHQVGATGDDSILHTIANMLHILAGDHADPFLVSELIHDLAERLIARNSGTPADFFNLFADPHQPFSIRMKAFFEGRRVAEALMGEELGRKESLSRLKTVLEDDKKFLARFASDKNGGHLLHVDLRHTEYPAEQLAAALLRTVKLEAPEERREIGKLIGEMLRPNTDRMMVGGVTGTVSIKAIPRLHPLSRLGYRLLGDRI